MTKDLSVDTMRKLNDKQEKEIKFLEKNFRHLEFPYRDDVLSLELNIHGIIWEKDKDDIDFIEKMMKNHQGIFEAKYELDHIMRFTIKIDSNYPLNGATYGTILTKDDFLIWIRKKFFEKAQEKSNATEKSPSSDLEDHTSKDGFDRRIA